MMKLREVHLLAEARDDLAQGRSFYDVQQAGVGDYFVESVLGDISTLRLHAGIHRRTHGFHRMLIAFDSPSRFTKTFSQTR